MDLITKIKGDMIAAYKANEKFKTTLLKLAMSESMRDDKNPSDESVLSTLKKMVKDANLVGTDEAKAEIAILSGYLPHMMSEDDVTIEVQRIADANPAVTGGKFVGLCMGSLRGKADGATINAAAKKIRP